MPKIDVPNEEERKIMEQNGLDPEKFCVTFRDKTTIALRNYKTRDDVTIRKGDRAWSV